jgi:putrescine transport system substrate-binding protein
LPSLIQASAFQALDKSKLSNYKHLDTEILEKTALFDKGNAYTVPYLWSITGLGYEAKKVKELLPNTPIDSWKILFNTATLQKLKKCDVSWLDEPDDMFPISSRSIGKDPYSQSAADITASFENLQKARPFVSKIHSSQYISDLVNGDICMAIGWSGDFHIAQKRAKQAKKNIDIRFVIPKEGAVMSVDSMAIPKDAPNPELAYKFINFLLEPKVIAGITNKIHFPNANKTAKQFVRKELLNNPVVYPSAADMKRITMDKPLPAKHRRHLMRRWTSILAMRQN